MTNKKGDNMTHECEKEAVFTKIFVGQEKMNTQLDTVISKLDGNGVPGIIEKQQEAHDFIIAQKEKTRIDTMSRKSLLIYGTLTLIIIEIAKEIIKIKISGG